MQNLIVYPKAMKSNLMNLGGLAYSQKVLLELIRAGISREDAYHLVQGSAMQAWKNGENFEDLLWSNKEINKRISRSHLRKCFDPAPYLYHVDTIFDRVFTPNSNYKRHKTR